MLARVKLFGPMSQAVGQAELPVTLAGESPTCTALRAGVFGVRAAASQSLGRGAASLSTGGFAPDEQILAEGDEIALIGFVSGG